MRKVTSLNDTYKQQFQFLISGYDSVDIIIEFKPLQEGWFFQSIIWGNFSVYQERIGVSPNLLRQWANVIPFGILVIGPDAIDPFSQDAWLQGWEMHILDETEIIEVEALYVRE